VTRVSKWLKIYAPKLYAKRLNKKRYLLALLVLLSASSLPSGIEASDQGLVVNVLRDVRLNSYGYLLLNDTLTLINNSTSPLSLPTVTLLYPTSAANFQVQQPLRKDWVRIERLSNVTALKLSADLTIPPSSNLTITISATLGELLKPLSKDRYEILIPMPSSLETFLAGAVVTISFPTYVNPMSAPEEFKQKTSEGGERLFAELKNIQPTEKPHATKLLLNATEHSLTLLNVERQERVVKIVSPNEVIVFDSVVLANEGSGVLYTLKISNEGLSSVTLVRGDLPLREQKKISIIASSLDFYNLIKDNLKAGDRLSFTVSYSLQEKPIASDNTLHLRIPQKPLIDALVKEYHLTIEAPKGCSVEGPTHVDLSYNSPLNNEEVSVSVRFGAAWGSAYAFSAATLIFIASFIALSTYVSSKREGKEQPLQELIKIYENELRSQEAIAYELASERPEHLQIQKIDLFAQQLKDLRARTSLKASQIRSKISLDPKGEQMLTELTSLDKAYERTLLDLLSAYRNYILGKLKRESFQKVVSDKSVSLKKVASSVRELLDDLSQM
jgi:hypothetical protein